MQIFQELELIQLNGIWAMELSLLIRLPFLIVIQLRVFIQLRSFAWDLTCNISDTIYDTLHFITTLSTATANAPADTTLCSNPPFAIPFTSDGSTPYVSWDFGDGNTSTVQNPTNTFATAGTYTVQFIAIDSNTCNIADTVPFTVELIQAPTFNASFNITGYTALFRPIIGNG